MNESEEKEEIKTFPLYPHLLQGQQALPNCKPISVGRPSEKKKKISDPANTQRRYNVAATSRRCSDVVTTLL